MRAGWPVPTRPRSPAGPSPCRWLGKSPRLQVRLAQPGLRLCRGGVRAGAQTEQRQRAALAHSSAPGPAPQLSMPVYEASRAGRTRGGICASGPPTVMHPGTVASGDRVVGAEVSFAVAINRGNRNAFDAAVSVRRRHSGRGKLARGASGASGVFRQGETLRDACEQRPLRRGIVSCRTVLPRRSRARSCWCPRCCPPRCCHRRSGCCSPPCRRR